MLPSVAIAEDDLDLRQALERGLTEAGFSVSAASNGAELLACVELSTPDVLVIDIGLPDSDGRDVCQAVRARGVQSPVIFLTARGALTDRLAGFHAGGDDYLVKPFEFKELVVRLRALARRVPAPGGARGRPAELRLDPASHAAATAEASVTLTPTEFRLLAALVARPGEVVRRSELVASGWPDGAIVHDNTLDTYVARLRRKLTELQTTAEIATVHGVGYRLD
jgi:two-component system OmpR family response regulator